MAKKSGGNIKQMLLQNGERWGFYGAAGLLAVFLVTGVAVALSGANPEAISKKIKDNTEQAQAKLRQPGGQPDPIDQDVFKPVELLKIPFNQYVTPNSFFNTGEDANPKRTTPQVLPAMEAQVEFVRGSIGAYDIIDLEGKPAVAVVVGREVTQNNIRNINELRRRRGKTPATGPNQPPRPGTPGAPGSPVPPPGGGGGGFGGSKGRGGAAGGGPSGSPDGGPGGGLGMNQQTTELQVNYVLLDSKDLERAKPAETLAPTKMVVVTGTVPYKKQVEEFVRALRANSMYDLTDLPIYRGLVVERQVWSADRKTLVNDWAPLDLQGSLGPVFAKTMEWEYDDLTPEQLKDKPELAELHPYFFLTVPDNTHKLLLPRPKLKRGNYQPINLPTVFDAMKELKKLGGEVKELKSATQQKLLGEGDIFGAAQNRGAAGLPGGPIDGGVPPPGGVPLPSGAPPSGSPPAGGPMMNKGRAGGPGRGGPGGPGGPGDDMRSANVQGGAAADAWLMRFIDVTTEPGYSYKYRVKVKMLNPNFQKPVQYLATPNLAEKEDLESDWFTIPGDPIVVPSDEEVYAASDEPRANPPKVTEKVPTANPDETWVQVHRWFDFVYPKGRERMKPEPVGEWMVADIRATRGQFLGETPKVELPIWSMTQSLFLFRDNPPPKRPGQRISLKDLRSWEVDFTPSTETLVVDFEGGTGLHPGHKGRQVQDTQSMDILLLDGNGKLRVIRSANDLADEERKKRLEAWTTWLKKVEEDTGAIKNQGTNPFGNGGVPPPGGGSPPPPGGSRDS